MTIARAFYGGFLVSVGVLVAVACGGTSSPSSSSTSKEGQSKECQDLEIAARQEFASVVRASGACETDADCVYVSNAASCWDACHGSVNKTRQPDIDAARAKVDAGQCATFFARGCKKGPVPPCVPPLPPACEKGECV